MASPFPQDGTMTFNLEGAYPIAALSHNPQAFAMNQQMICKRCHHVGVDVKMMDCGCCLHARCTPVSENHSIANCPACHAPARALFLMPMNFDELDAAKASAATMAPSAKRGKKRKNATIARLNPSANTGNSEENGDGSDLRTGRWTTEETLYCDKLIENFETGSLPISEAIKLNDFLANMLKSKQSRLTKKMKNARLSAKTYKRSGGFIGNFEQAKQFSELEKSFFDSIQCDLERAEIRFHMQKEWRELFSTYCVAVGQKLDADSWLSSVEEMDRRVSQAKDAARMARRKVMMGYALSQDSMNQERGVFIENPTSADASQNEILSGHKVTNANNNGQNKPRTGNSARELRDFSSPFVGKVIQYMHRHQVPFEHIDAWVPSFIPNPDQAVAANGEQQKCRLCFAGFATTESQLPAEGGRLESLGQQDQFDLLSFGEYSSKFSFDVGCGLPGRVYSSGICSWEQGVANAPSNQFERCGGASQWGIKTVLGIPIPSPNVGRIVVLLYSRHDRLRDGEMVRRITDELTKLMPTPKWKLVVDVGAAPAKQENSGKPADGRITEVLKLMAEHIPTHRNSPYAPYLSGFSTLRLLLVKQDRTSEEEELLGTTLESYSSYLSSGRRGAEIAWMVARDFMLLSQTSAVQQLQQQQAPQQAQLPPTQQIQAPVGTPIAPSTGMQQQLHQHQQQQMRQVASQNNLSQIQNFSHLAPHPSTIQQQISLGLPQMANHQQQQHLTHPGAAPLQAGALQLAGMMQNHQQKAVLAPAQALTHTAPGPLSSQILLSGVSQLQNGSQAHMSPNPAFGLQQSAFLPVSQQQHAGNQH